MSIRNLLAAALGNAFTMLTAILLAFYFLGQPAVWLLRVVLETLSGK